VVFLGMVGNREIHPLSGCGVGTGASRPLEMCVDLDLLALSCRGFTSTW
jgi:hypothetical protein